MKLIISLLISAILIVLLEKKIKKHSMSFYSITTIFGVVTALLPDTTLPSWLSQIIADYITRGTYATSLFVIVMYATLIPKNSRFKKIFMGLRGEIAILASLLILSHSIYYGKHYFVLLFTDASSMKPTELIAAIASLLMLILMAPLTITSFKYIRKKMVAKKWKWLQRWSYLFYGLIYFHVAILFRKHILAGDLGYTVDLCIYTIVFAWYSILRIQKTLQMRNKVKWAKVVFIIGSILVILACLYIGITGYKNNKKQNTKVDSKASNGEGYKDGTFTGEGIGFNGTVKVEVVIKEGKISEINVLESADDYEYFTNAEATIPKEIMESQSTDVDVVSGATYSSKGIIAAVADALQNSME